MPFYRTIKPEMSPAEKEAAYLHNLKMNLTYTDKTKLKVISEVFQMKTASQLINTIFNLSSFDLDENITSYEDLAIRHIEDTQSIDVELYEYIDLEQLGRDLAMQDISFVTDDGYLVISGGFPDKPFYNGVEDIATKEIIYERRGDIPEYSGINFAAVRTKDGSLKRIEPTPSEFKKIAELIDTAKVKDLKYQYSCSEVYLRALI